MTLDMFAVLFGGAKALLPIYAVDILHADAAGYGILTASLDVGSLIAATVMIATARADAHRPRAAAVGRGVSAWRPWPSASRTWLPLSVVAYAAVGAADQVSVVMRLNTIQLSIPDELRGRVTAVNFVFINASNQIGGLESGVVAAVTNAVFAVVSGGVACLIVVGIIGWRIPRAAQLPGAQRPASLTPRPQDNRFKASDARPVAVELQRRAGSGRSR